MDLKHNFLYSIVQLLLIYTGCYLVAFSLLVIISPLMSSAGIDVANNMAFLKTSQCVLQIMTFLAPVLIFYKINRIKPIEAWNSKRRNSPFIILLSLSLLIVSAPLITWLITINENFTFPEGWKSIEVFLQQKQQTNEDLVNKFLDVNTLGGFIINIFVMAMIPAICEEVFFRGTLQKMFVGAIRNYHVAILLSALIFSIAHFEFYGLLPRFVLGAIIGYIYYYSGKIWLPITFHFINNCNAVAMAFIIKKYFGGNEITTTLSEPSTTLVILSAILTLSGIVAIRKYRKQPMAH